jgi:hypothetical protein
VVDWNECMVLNITKTNMRINIYTKEEGCRGSYLTPK